MKYLNAGLIYPSDAILLATSICGDVTPIVPIGQRLATWKSVTGKDIKFHNIDIITIIVWFYVMHRSGASTRTTSCYDQFFDSSPQFNISREQMQLAL